MQDAAETRTSAQITALPVTSSSIDEGRFVPGTLIVGRYRIISLLGRGGMGEVYRATDLTLGQPVALKFLPNTGEGFDRLLERFQNEVRVARQVSHPNVCRVYDLGEFDGMPYMSMEYVDGEDLSGLLARIGRLPADKALDIARKLCAGLAAAHDKGVIHRDLKPANIMLDKRGSPIIMDFGLAAVTNELRGAEARSGSPAYQAPEQLRGEEVTARSDIYALGLVLYELFTGRRAYDAKSIAELIRNQEQGEFISMQSIAADIDPGVETAIRRCLDPVAVQRPASALNVSALLPGGDPLAAALAAGETLSPELLAAAGRSKGLKLVYSAPMALALVAFTLAIPLIRHNRERQSLAPMDLPPQALAAKVRDFATAFGYPAIPADTEMWVFSQEQVTGEVIRLSKAKGFDEVRRLFRSESPYRMVYRESPMKMVPSDGRVTLMEPAPTLSGMISAVISSTGHLRHFAAVPDQTDAAGAAVPIDPVLLSRATGFDLSAMEPVLPRFTPLYAFDWQRAWKGKHPVLGSDIQIEAAAWHGKLTELQIIWPWTIPARMPDRAAPLSKEPQELLWSGLGVVVFVISVLLAARNLRAGRSDLKGALHLATIVFILRTVQHFAYIHWTADVAMFSVVLMQLSVDLAGAGSVWLLYLAMEPAVRSRWPQIMVSWTRVLRGQWNQPYVAKRVLQGCFTGSLIAAAVLSPMRFQGVDGVAYHLQDPIRAMSVRHFISDLAALAGNGIQVGLLIIFAIFLFRTILKRDWAAAVAMSVVMTASNGELWRHFGLIDMVFYLTAISAIAFVMLRLGLLATISAITFVDLLLHIPGAQDLTKWYEWTVIAYPLAAITVIAWAFWCTSADEILRTEPETT